MLEHTIELLVATTVLPSGISVLRESPDGPLSKVVGPLLYQVWDEHPDVSRPGIHRAISRSADLISV